MATLHLQAKNQFLTIHQHKREYILQGEYHQNAKSKNHGLIIESLFIYENENKAARFCFFYLAFLFSSNNPIVLLSVSLKSNV